MKFRFFAILAFLMCQCISLHGQELAFQHSVLRSGTWAKFRTEQTGVYKLTFNDLSGILAGSVPSSQVHIYSSPGGALPQLNAENGFFDPREVSRWIEDGGDGEFGPGDFVVFYLEGPDQIQADPQTQAFHYEGNPYTDFRYFLVGIHDLSEGIQPELVSNQADGGDIVEDFDKVWIMEDERINRLSSGREWYGDYFSATASRRNYTLPLENVSVGSEVTVAAELVAYSYLPSKFELAFGSTPIGEIPFDNVVRDLDDEAYESKGVVVADTFTVSSSLISGEDLSLIFYPASGVSRTEGYLDKLYIQYVTPLTMNNSFLEFQKLGTEVMNVVNYRISGADPVDMVWDVSDNYLVENIAFEKDNDGNVSFGVPTEGEVRKFIAIDLEGALLQPEWIGEINNRDITGIDAVHFLVITHADFAVDAQRLASHRTSFSGLSSLVVDIDEIYETMNAGTPDISAIRNYIRYMYQRSDAPGTLRYVLIMGKGTYDFKDKLNRGNNFIPLYQSRNSLDPLKTYGSDDYLGFLESDEGIWPETGFSSDDMDVGIGRIPVKTVEEASVVVDKIIGYDLAKKEEGKWRNKVVFVADDGDFNTHHSQSSQLSQFVESTYSGVQTRKLFLDSFVQETGAGGGVSPEMEAAIDRTVEEGVLIMNYAGHGSPGFWMQEGALDNEQIEAWSNQDKLPLFVTATCEFGRHDNPVRVSGGELVLLNPHGGGIGLVTTGRVVYASTNYQLSRAFYEEVFTIENGESLTLGEIFRRTKNNSQNGVFNRNFSLLGDPSMQLAYPKLRATVTSVNEQAPEDVSLSALKKVRVTGQIIDLEGQLVNDFQGEAEISMYDKQSLFRTLGDENSPYSFKEWSALIFQGKATITDGEWAVEFIIPKNIYYDLGSSKFSLYAFDEVNGRQAVGSNLNIQVGGTSDVIDEDTSPPEIMIYLNDRTFRSGDVVGERPVLWVDFFDESGISQTGLGIDKNILAVLDEKVNLNLNSYYVAETDNYRQGTVEFQMDQLEPGPHKIRISALDTYNNRGESVVDFVVGKDGQLLVREVRNVPNPFTEETILQFQHNKAGQNLWVDLQIIDRTGRVILAREYNYEEAETVIQLPAWTGVNDSGQPLEQGIYFALIRLKSLSDGTKNSITCKLIYLK